MSSLDHSRISPLVTHRLISAICSISSPYIINRLVYLECIIIDNASPFWSTQLKNSLVNEPGDISFALVCHIGVSCSQASCLLQPSRNLSAMDVNMS